MLGIGLPELMLILIVALIVIGPDRLPELTRAVGKAYQEFKKAGEEIRKGVTEVERDISENTCVKETGNDGDRDNDRLDKNPSSSKPS